jgi:starch synthase
VSWALNTTLDWFEDVPSWRRLMLNGMQKDFSWDRQIGEYERVFAETAAAPALPLRS